MAITYLPIGSTLISSNTASITFSSISASYTDLIILLKAKGSGGSAYDYLSIKVNGNSSNYGNQVIAGITATATVSGPSTFTTSWNRTYFADGGTTGGTEFSLLEFYLSQYTNGYAKAANSYYVMPNMSNNGVLGSTGMMWNATNAITSVVIQPLNGQSFIAGTRADLYGILKA